VIGNISGEEVTLEVTEVCVPVLERGTVITVVYGVVIVGLLVGVTTVVMTIID